MGELLKAWYQANHKKGWGTKTEEFEGMETLLPLHLTDNDVGPYGYNDFYDAPQLFCSNSKLGLGIGNVDRNYPLFGIPILQLCDGS